MPEWLAYDPQDNLGFFADLQRNHFPPFYYIPALHDHPISLNDRHVAKERPARKVLRTLEADTDKSEMGLTGEVGIAECDTVLQAECKAESSNRGKENEGMETVNNRTLPRRVPPIPEITAAAVFSLNPRMETMSTRYLLVLLF
jgi:hypothetical protein